MDCRRILMVLTAGGALLCGGAQAEDGRRLSPEDRRLETQIQEVRKRLEETIPSREKARRERIGGMKAPKGREKRFREAMKSGDESHQAMVKREVQQLRGRLAFFESLRPKNARDRAAATREFEAKEEQQRKDNQRGPAK